MEVNANVSKGISLRIPSALKYVEMGYSSIYNVTMGTTSMTMVVPKTVQFKKTSNVLLPHPIFLNAFI
jgi:hypothetical protein